MLQRDQQTILDDCLAQFTCSMPTKFWNLRSSSPSSTSLPSSILSSHNSCSKYLSCSHTYLPRSRKPQTAYYLTFLLTWGALPSKAFVPGRKCRFQLLLHSRYSVALGNTARRRKLQLVTLHHIEDFFAIKDSLRFGSCVKQDTRHRAGEDAPRISSCEWEGAAPC